MNYLSSQNREYRHLQRLTLCFGGIWGCIERPTKFNSFAIFLYLYKKILHASLEPWRKLCSDKYGNYFLCIGQGCSSDLSLFKSMEKGFTLWETLFPEVILKTTFWQSTICEWLQFFLVIFFVLENLFGQFSLKSHVLSLYSVGAKFWWPSGPVNSW